MYTTLDKITGQLSESTVIQLTDDEGLEVVNTARVDEAIANADAVIDGYCSGRYVVPFDPAPAIIAKCSLDMAIYNLYARRVETMPEVRDKSYANAIKLLVSIAKGEVLLNGSTTPPPAPDTARSGMAITPVRQFSRDTLRGL
jgi:phage gp36-like protein